MLQPLDEFFANSEIFVTGGSGVVGKALIEKLLRSCNVKCIYMLLRSRNQMSAEQRLDKLRQAKIFQLLRTQKPNELNKLVAIPGDVSLPGLGIDPTQMPLFSRVSIVFHCAATVRFDEPLRVAIQLNVGGTLETLKFAEKLRHLRIFVHVSTFFSNPYLTHVEPRYYSSPMDWRLCLRLVDEIKDDNLLNTLTRKLIVGFPNTYTFTKNLAESLVNDYRTRLPLIVYRPSIVLCALRDPKAGFAPSLMGALGIFSLVAAGLQKSVYIGRNTRLDITPQDVGVKSMLYFTMLGYQTYSEGKPEKLLVYQTSSSNYVTNTFVQLAERMDRVNVWAYAPLNKNLLLPGCHYTDNRFVYKFLVYTKQLIPALLIDFLLICFGRQPELMRIMRRSYHTLKVMEPFMFNNYDSPTYIDLAQMLHHLKGTEFDLCEDYENAGSPDHLFDASKKLMFSIRHDLLNEDPSTLPRAKLVMRIKTIIYHLMRTYLLYKLFSWLWNSFFAQYLG